MNRHNRATGNAPEVNRGMAPESERVENLQKLSFTKGSTVRLHTIAGCMLLLMGAAAAFAGEVAPLESGADRFSYAIGASTGKNLQIESPDINLDLMVEGLRAGFSGKGLRMNDREMRVVLSEYQTRLRRRSIELREQAKIDNKKAGEEYLAANKVKPGVNILPGGVQYSVVKQGAGLVARESDSVVINYRGTLVNGVEFDSTQPEKPLTLRVATLITGWKIALKAMPAGSVWHVVIPSDMAYGERGIGEIGPNQVLIFDMELLAVQRPGEPIKPTLNGE